jgi:hypothetical protein
MSESPVERTKEENSDLHLPGSRDLFAKGASPFVVGQSRADHNPGLAPVSPIRSAIPTIQGMFYICS